MAGEFNVPDGAAPNGDVPVTPTESVAESSEQVITIPPIAGFWRRMAAFVLDVVFLGIVGQLLGLSLSSIWFQIGPYGRIVGQPIALLYFGIMDSGVAGGQTLGKRLLRVAVRNAEGQRIGVGRSMLRTLVWLVPVTLNGWALPAMSDPIVAGVASIVVFGVSGAVAMTLLFNRRTRQGIHDMLAGTYVLYLDGRTIELLPKPARLQWMLSGAMLVLAVALTGLGGFLASRPGAPLQQVLELQRTLKTDSRFIAVGVFDQKFRVWGGDTTRTLGIQVWYKGVPTEAERTTVMNDVARKAVAVADVERYDLIRIEVMSAYDLGIATWHVSHFDSQSVSTWRERIGEGST